MTVHLVERKGIYHAVISYKDEYGKWRQKSQSTSYKIKGNKKNAEKKAKEILEEFDKEYKNRNLNINGNILFSDFLYSWLEMKKLRVRENTLHAYKLNIDKHIKPYFEERNIKLCDLNQRDLQAFINKKLEVVSPNTVLKYHQHIYSALKYAVRLDLIQFNVADRVELPRKVKPRHCNYSVNELKVLLKVAKNEPIESAVILAVFYGLRREEALGLRYSDVDFINKTIHINHTAILVGTQVKYVDNTKTSTSNRTLPLIPEVEKYLISLRKKQEHDKKLFGDCYKDSEYICRDNTGKLIHPTYLTHYFNKMLKRNNLRHIRYHDLRHSTATNLLAKGSNLKEIQEWLGHSNISTTSDIYCELMFEAKIKTSNIIQSDLAIED